MFTPIVGGSTLAILVLVALDDFIKSKSGTGPIAARRSLAAKADAAEQLKAADPGV